ncbi:MAG: hypothetical protein ACRC7S_08770 [Cetobacterium sp.]
MKDNYKELVRTDLVDMVDDFRKELVCLDFEESEKVKEVINILFDLTNCVSAQLYETLAVKNIETLKKYEE